MKVSSVKVLDGFRLSLLFENGEEGTVDLSDIAGRGVTKAWLQRQVFESVSVTQAGALEWPGNVDIDGDTLYLRATGKSPSDLYPAI